MDAMDEIKDTLCNFSDSQLDSSMKPLIRKWSNPPKAIEILEVLDHCIYGFLASGFVVMALQILYKGRCDEEKTTHEEVVRLATWRT